MNSATFDAALTHFRSGAGLTQDEENEFRQTSLEVLWREIAKLQKTQEQSRHLKYMRRLEPFLKSMEQYSKIIEVFLNVSDLIAFVWVGKLVCFRDRRDH